MGKAVDRLAWVTGGSRGLGLALCEQLRDEGFEIVEFSRSAPHPWSVRLDLGRLKDVDATVQAAARAYDPLAPRELLLINNAGLLTPLGVTARQPEAAVLRNLNVNLVAPVLLLRTLMQHFQACPGRKVLAQVSSGAALRAHEGLSLYGAAKAGMEHYLRVLALEQLREAHPWTTVTLDPGAMDTDMQGQLRSAASDDLPAVRHHRERQQQGLLADCRQVAAAALQALRAPGLASGSRCLVAVQAPRLSSVAPAPALPEHG